MKKMFLIILFITFYRVSAVIYHLNDTEYAKMPPLFHLDSYEPCVQKTGGIYCMVDMDLVSDSDSQLLDMIREYSDRKETHFNHSRLHYGICLAKYCKDFELNKTVSNNLNASIENCMNTSFLMEYKLKIKISDFICHSKEETYIIESEDVATAVILFFLFLLNLIGSVYDLVIVKNNDRGVRWLLCFSIKRNLYKLIHASRNENDNRINCFKSFDGMRVMTIFLVIIIHSILPFISYIDNPHFFETMYNKIPVHLVIDGTGVIQTSFIISGCLLSYNLQIDSEKNKLTWRMIPKGILLRWLRLTPPYAVVLAITATWLRFAGSGPLWQKMIGEEVKDCRRDGWQNMLYINNYFDNTRCMAHTWYLAVIMQLYIIGILTLLLTRNDLQRQFALSFIFVISLFTAPLHTYFQDLHGNVILSPEVAREYFVKDPTFNNSYKRGHTNMTCYILGLSLGLVIYKMQVKQLDVEKYKKYKYLIWATISMIITLILCTGLLYMDGVTPHVISRAVFAGIYRPFFGLFLSIFILGMVFKLENVYRPVLEWRGWASLACVSYSAYLLHVILIQVVTYSRTTLNHITLPLVIMTSVGSVAISFLVAVPLWLLVESPITQIVKLLTSTDNIRNKSRMFVNQRSETKFTPATDALTNRLPENQFLLLPRNKHIAE